MPWQRLKGIQSKVIMPCLRLLKLAFNDWPHVDRQTFPASLSPSLAIVEPVVTRVQSLQPDNHIGWRRNRRHQSSGRKHKIVVTLPKTTKVPPSPSKETP